MATMEFGVAFGPQPTAHTAPQIARLADELGFHHLTFMDCGFVAREVHVMMTLALLNSTRLRVGHGVTDPLTYRPSELANIACTLNELSGGRAFIGLGLGGTASRPSTRPATRKELREAVDFIHKYSAGEDAEWQGHSWCLQWLRDTEMAGTPAHVVLGGFGPKMLQLAGEVADTAMVGGVEPEFLKWQKSMIAKGAARAGRDPSEVKLWARTMIHVSSSKEEARRELAPWAAIRATGTWNSICSRPSDDTAELLAWLEQSHPGLVDEWKQISDAWDEYAIGVAGGAQDRLVSQRTVDFFGLTGGVDEIVERVAMLEQLGITALSCSLLDLELELASPHSQGSGLHTIAREIMPHFQ
jgi:5,10-methylenetetrahydromethanopterin reductase